MSDSQARMSDSSNDSREAFEAAVIANYEQPPCLDRMGHSYEDAYIDQAWWGWQAAQSHHAAEREALVRKVKALESDTAQMIYQSYDYKDGYEVGYDSAKDAVLSLLSDSAQGGEDSGRMCRTGGTLRAD